MKVIILPTRAGDSTVVDVVKKFVGTVEDNQITSSMTESSLHRHLKFVVTFVEKYLGQHSIVHIDS